MLSLGKKIRELRKEKDVSQTTLGKHLGVGKTTISNYETGYSTPDNEVLIKLAKYFNVSVDYLLGNSETKNPYKEEEHELSDDDIITLAAHSIGHLNDLSEEDKEKVRLAIKIALMKDKSSKGD